MTGRTEMVHSRLTLDEKTAFAVLATKVGEKPSRLIRKFVREAINGEIDLLYDEQQLLLVAIRQLAGIANNLNQITAAIHAGITHRTVDENYLTEVKKLTLQVKKELETYVKRARQRWVKLP